MAISAFSGTGKTSLANKYGYLMKANQNNYIRWLKAENQSLFQGDYKQLYMILDFDGKNKSTELIIDELYAKLTDITQNNDRTFYLILDNVEKYEDIQEFINDNLPSKVKVLITTRNNELNYSNIKYVKIDPFNMDESLIYIQKCNVKKLQNNQSKLDEILNTIGINNQGKFEVIPIKLKLTIAFINTSYRSIENDLEKLNFKSFWATLIDNVREKSENAFILLQYSAFLDPEFVMIDFFYSFFEEEKVNESIEILKELSLVEVISHEIQDYEYHEDRTIKSKFNVSIFGIKIHRLIQKEVREYTRSLFDMKEILKRIVNNIDKFFLGINHLYSKKKSKIKEKLSFFFSRTEMQKTIRKVNLVNSLINYLENENIPEFLREIYNLRMKIAWFYLICIDYKSCFFNLRATYKYYSSLLLTSPFSKPALSYMICKFFNDIKVFQSYIGLLKIGKILSEIVLDLFQAKLVEMLQKKYGNFGNFIRYEWLKIKDLPCENSLYLRKYKHFVKNMIIKAHLKHQLFNVEDWVKVARYFLKKEIRPKQSFLIKYTTSIKPNVYRVKYKYDLKEYFRFWSFHRQTLEKPIQLTRHRDTSFGGMLNNMVKILRAYKNCTEEIRNPGYLTMGLKESCLILNCLKGIIKKLLKYENNATFQKFETIANYNLFDQNQNDNIFLNEFGLFHPEDLSCFLSPNFS